jgi:hypothetical protein
MSNQNVTVEYDESGVRRFVIRKEAAPAKKVTKAEQQRERKASVGRGNAKIRNAARRPSPVITTTF